MRVCILHKPNHIIHGPGQRILAWWPSHVLSFWWRTWGYRYKKAHNSTLQKHAVISLVCGHAAVQQPHVLDVGSVCISLSWWGEREGTWQFWIQLLTRRYDPSWWIVLKNMKPSGSCWGRNNVPAASLLNWAAPAVWSANIGDLNSRRHNPPTWRHETKELAIKCKG